MARSGTTRRRTTVILGKVKGYVTRKPPIRAFIVKLQAVARAKLLPRIFTKVFLGKPFGGTPPVIIPKAIKVIKQSVNRNSVKERLKTHTKFIKVFGGVVVAAAVFPKAIQILLQAINRRILNPRFKTQTQFTKVFGYATVKPPVRKLQVLLQAVTRSKLQSRIKTKSVFTKAFGGIVAGIIFVNYGAQFLFTAANWSTLAVHLEVYMRAVIGTVYARLFDEVDALPVANSIISTVSGTFNRIRSPELNLVDTHTYRIQLGKLAVDSGEILSGRLIMLNT